MTSPRAGFRQCRVKVSVRTQSPFSADVPVRVGDIESEVMTESLKHR